MNSLLIRISAVLLLIVSTGCSVAPKGPPFTEAAPPTSQQSLIYFYRPDSPPFLRSPDIYINETKVVDMENQGYSYLYTAPGRYTIRSSWSADIFIGDKSITLDAKGGQTYFVQQNSWMKTWFPVALFDGSFQLVTKLQGMDELMKSRFVPPFVQTINTQLSSNQKFPVLAKVKDTE